MPAEPQPLESFDSPRTRDRFTFAPRVERDDTEAAAAHSETAAPAHVPAQQPRLQRAREMWSSRFLQGLAGQVQRKAAGPSESAVIPPETAGELLPAEMRSPLESHFQSDLSAVRVHTDRPAGESARDAGALAYTSGRDIYFAPGMYAPASAEGRQLLAHEVAHVVQQGSGAVPTAPEGLSIDDPSHPLEAAADQAAASFNALSTEGAAQPKRQLSLPASPAVQRQQAAAAAPTVVATRVERRITVGTSIRNELFAINIDLDDATAPAFDADPGLQQRLANSLGALFNPPEGALPETTRFLSGPRVKALIEKDLPAWLAGSGLPALAAVLAARAAAIRKQRVRVALETWLGVPAGTVDWNAQLPLLRAELPGLIGNTAEEASQLDRVEMFVHMLENEVARSPAVEGAKSPPNLAASVFKYATTVVQYEDEVRALFGEKFLTPYLDAIAKIRFVPDDFDLARFAPSGADIAEARRNLLIDGFIKNDAPDLATQFLLDEWTVSGASPESYLAGLDLDKEQDRIIDHLTDKFFERARGDAALASAVREIAADRARYTLLASVVQFARTIEMRNQELPALGAKDVFSLDQDERAIVHDPATYYQTCSCLASATTTILNQVSAGASVAAAAIENAGKIAGQADIPKNFAGIVALISLANSIASLKRTVDEQLVKARERIASRMRLSWKDIADVVNKRGQAADDYIQKTWIPKLKEIALGRIRDNYNDLKKWLDNFSKETPNVIGRYRLAAAALEEVANKLDSGEAESVVLEGQVLERKDVKQARTAIAYLRAKATKLETQKGQDDKKAELQKAVDAFADVKAGIESGKYKPLHFGPSIYEQARKELGIGGFEPGTTVGVVVLRKVVAGSNPFQNWAIARWQYTETVYEHSDQLMFFAGIGLLTIASFLLPGITHAVLGALGVGFGVSSAVAAGVTVVVAATDIGIGVHQGVKGVRQARAQLDLARLDPDLSIQGVSVEEAETALRHAWISLFITLALAGIFAAVLGRGLLKGIEAARLPFLTRLGEADPLLAAKIVERTGGTKLANTLLGHFAGDGQKVWEALAYVKDAERLSTLITQVKDADLARRLLIAAGHETELTPLLADFKNYTHLEVLLGKATPYQLVALHDLVKTEAAVTKLLDVMDFVSAQRLVQSGLSADEALAVNSLGPDAVRNYFRVAALGDKTTQEGVLELLRLNKTNLAGGKGTFSNAATTDALAKTADFMTKYAGRAKGDFVSRFARVAATDEELARLKNLLAEAKAAGKNTAQLETRIARAEAAAGRARAEVQTAEDILEGRTALGPDRTVTGLRERSAKDLEGIGTPEFRVSGGGQPDRLVEVKAIGAEPGKPIGKNALANNFGDAAGQVAEQAVRGTAKTPAGDVVVPGTGEREGLVRLDASATGNFNQTNEELRSTIAGKWGSIFDTRPERAGTVRWVEIIDKGADGNPQRLLLEIDGRNVRIVPAGTTRVDPVK